MELLKQPQYTPFPVEDQVASVWAGTKGKLDDVDLGDVRRFEAEMLDYLRRHSTVLSTMASTGVLTDETEEELGEAIEAFRRTFLAGTGAAITADGAAVGPVEVEQERIIK